MKKTLRAIIVEDEELARNLLKEYLKEIPSVQIIGEFADGFSGAKAINEMKPDLLLLDIQMPKLTGFELLEILDYKPKIIFTTAFDQFAIKAFEMNAVDYLLKPYSRDRLRNAVDKVYEQMKTGQETPIAEITKHIDRSDERLRRVVVKSGKKISIIATWEINYLEAQDDYIMLYCSSGKYLKQKTMNYFEAHLDPKQFIRIHRSYIVNVDQINRLELYEKDTYRIHLKNETTIPVSKTGLKKLKSGLDF